MPRLHTAAVSALSLALLFSLFRVDGVPAWILLLLVAFAAFATWRPTTALLACALLLPISRWVGRGWNYLVAWPEALAVALIGGWCARLVVTRRDRLHTVDVAALALGTLVVGSLAVRLLLLHETAGGAALLHQLRQLVAADYFVGDGGFPDVDAAMRLLEGLFLLCMTASAVRERPAIGLFVARSVAAGAALAAAINLLRLWEGALRSEAPLGEFFGYLVNLRYNVHFADVNAAGSYFVMALMPAGALALSPGRWRALWALASLIIASSLIMSGSRSALAAGVAAVVLVGVARAINVLRERGSLRPILVAVALLVVVAVPVVYLSASRNQASSSTALEVRAEFARTSFRMFATRPVFGVGIGRYPELSDHFTSPRRFAIFRARQENAHNNFLQVLAELGATGLVALLAVMLVAGRHALADLGRDGTLLSRGAACGLLAFVITWLGGHPMLIDEPALTFWLLLGATAGITATGAASRVRTLTAIASVIVLLIAVSVPFRAGRERAVAELEHRGIGLSGWQFDDAGVRYRLAGGRSTVFAPASARTITLPLRGVPSSGDLRVSILLDGVPANVVTVVPDRWLEFRMLLPPSSDAPLFHRIDLRVDDDSQETRLMVGKIEPH
jgi:O-antigen ligase